MTNNLDQFDQSPDFDQESVDGEKRAGIGANLSNAWRTKPVFKLVVLLLAVGSIIALIINFTTSAPPQTRSSVAGVPNLVEAPGGKASPAFIDAQNEANKQRTQEAAAAGGTALPTPLPSGMNTEGRKEGDPLVEFRAEMQKQKEEQARQIEALQQQSQRQQSTTIQQDHQVQQQLGQSLQAQMTQLATLWKPHPFVVIRGATQDDKKQAVSGTGGSSSVPVQGSDEQQADDSYTTSGAGMGPPSQTTPAPAKQFNKERGGKPLILAGTVNYAQLLTEANTDVPGPILAQIVSGPLSGARAIGSFKEGYDMLSLNFSTATLKGKEYKIKALALDPDTTLGGMASEVDHRYFARVLLPAAATFVAAFGTEIGKKPQTVVVTGSGQVITSQARSGIKDGLYAGLGSAGQSIAGFLQNEASQTKVLIRIAVGTPMGLFFLESVCAGKYTCSDRDATPTPATPPTITASSSP